MKEKKKSTKEDRERLARDLFNVVTNPACPHILDDRIDEVLNELVNTTQVCTNLPEVLLVALPLQIEILEEFDGFDVNASETFDYFAKARKAAR